MKIKNYRGQKHVFVLVLVTSINAGAAQNPTDCDCSPQAVTGECRAVISKSGNWINIKSNGGECSKVNWFANEDPLTTVLIHGHATEEWGGILNKEPNLSVFSCKICTDQSKRQNKKEETSSQRTKDQFHDLLKSDIGNPNPSSQAPLTDDETSPQRAKDQFQDLLKSNGTDSPPTHPAAQVPKTADEVKRQANVEAMKRKIEQAKVEAGNAREQRDQEEIKFKLESERSEAKIKDLQAQAEANSNNGAWVNVLGAVLQGVAVGVQGANTLNTINNSAGRASQYKQPSSSYSGSSQSPQYNSSPSNPASPRIDTCNMGGECAR
jgi:hypothetical protein